MKITLDTIVGGKIVGDLQETQGSKQLLLMCHGLQSSAEHPAIKAITQKLYEHGHAVLAFNFSDTHGMDLERQVEDIIQLVEYFSSYDEFILLGGSFGALSSATAVNKSPKIKGLVTVNGFFGSGRLGKSLLPTYLTFKAMTLTSAKAKKFWRFYKEQFRPERITVPVLVIHSKADKDVSMMQSKVFFTKLSGPKEFHTLETSDHNLQPGDEIDAIVSRIHGWLKRLDSK